MCNMSSAFRLEAPSIVEERRPAHAPAAERAGRKAAFVAIDTEYTGVSRAGANDSRIIQIAIVPFDAQGQILTDDEGRDLSWWTYVNPEGRRSSSYAQAVHGITEDKLVKAPRFRQIAKRVWHILRDRIVVAHNFSADGSHLANEFERLEKLSEAEKTRWGLVGEDYHLTPPWTEVCTQRLAREHYKARGWGKKSVALGDACHLLGVRLLQRHDALHDAEAAGRLYAVIMGQRSKDEPLLAPVAQEAPILDTFAIYQKAKVAREALAAQVAREALEAEAARQPLPVTCRTNVPLTFRELCPDGKRAEHTYPAHTPVLLYRDGREAEVRLPSSPEPHLSRIVDRKLLEVIP